MKSKTVEILSAKGSISFEVKVGEKKPFKDSHAKVNTTNRLILKQLRYNMKRPLPQLRLSPVRDEELVILAGGPSMIEFVEEIKERIAAGAKCMVLNGAHDWAAAQGITRHFFAMIDMQPTSARFVQNPHPGVVYLLSSACHPSVFDALAEHRVYMFHCAGMQSRTGTLKRYYFNRPLAWVDGGSTIGLRAPMVAWWLGFRKLHFYGLDSCIMDTQHHAYPQDLNDDNSLEEVHVGDRVFFCQGWMVDQACGFLNMIRDAGDRYQMQVHGDGLIAYLMRYVVEKGDELDRAA